jgi:hypothetical protein
MALVDEAAHLLAHHAQVFAQDVGFVEFEFGHGWRWGMWLRHDSWF